MIFLTWYFLLFVVCIWLIPYLIWGILQFALWRFDFRISIVSFLTYTDIMLNIPIHLNFNMLLRIKKFKIRFSTKSKPVSIQIEGFNIGKAFCLLHFLITLACPKVRKTDKNRTLNKLRVPILSDLLNLIIYSLRSHQPIWRVAREKVAASTHAWGDQGNSSPQGYFWGW